MGGGKSTRPAAALPAILLVLLAAACGREEAAEPPAPVQPDRDALTHYGRMILVDHRGPKAQIHLTSAAEPLWFSQVRDAIAFTLSPEEPSDITAVFVTDMAQAGGWSQPDTWIPAEEAVYVIDSRCRGGMGALEAVPFSRRAAAEAFIRLHGGEIVGWDTMPAHYILRRAIEAPASPVMMGMASEAGCRRLAPPP